MEKSIEELKKIKIAVIDKKYRRLSPTNLLIAQTLIAREKAVWVIKNKKIMLLKTQKDWKDLKKKVIKEEKRICYICKETIPEEIPATVDHVNPKSKLGKDDRKNLRCCCKRCNDDKANMNYIDYVTHMKSNKEKYNYINFDKLEVIE